MKARMVIRAEGGVPNEVSVPERMSYGERKRRRLLRLRGKDRLPMALFLSLSLTFCRVMIAEFVEVALLPGALAAASV